MDVVPVRVGVRVRVRLRVGVGVGIGIGVGVGVGVRVRVRVGRSFVRFYDLCERKHHGMDLIKWLIGAMSVIPFLLLIIVRFFLLRRQAV